MAGDGLGRGAERCVTGAVSARADEEVLAVDAGTAARPVRVPRRASACLGVLWPRAAPSAAVGVAPVGLAAMKLSREVGQARPAGVCGLLAANTRTGAPGADGTRGRPGLGSD